MENTRASLNESIKLDQSTVLPGSVVQFLTAHQLEGIRFIHRGLLQNDGVILNDESGLGKTHQVVGYLSAALGPADKSAILCSDLQRVHHWMYHLQLLTKLETVIYSGDTCVESYQIIFITQDTLKLALENILSKDADLKLLVIDETKGCKLDDSALRTIALIATKKLFLHTSHLMDEPIQFYQRLEHCKVQFLKDSIRDLIEEITSKQSSKKSLNLKLFFLTRSVYLRRYRSDHKRDLPLVDTSEFEQCFECWKIAHGIVYEQPEPQMDTNNGSDQLFNFVGAPPDREDFDEEAEASGLNEAICEDVEDSPQEVDSSGNDGMVVTLAAKVSEPMFDFEQSTEDMPHLVVESSDSDEIVQSVRDCRVEGTRSPPSIVEVPETEPTSQKTDYQTDSEGYLEFGQALKSTSSESGTSFGTVINKNEPQISEAKYHFPIDSLLRRKSTSSNEIEIASKQSAQSNVIVISSSGSNGAGREKSPDLFSDTDNEADETVPNQTQDSIMELLLKSPVELEAPATSSRPPIALPRLPNSNVSTPISKLIHGQLQMARESPSGDASTSDIFADITVKKLDPNRTDNVFEITDNNAFGKKIQVHVEKDSMSPLRDSDEVQFVGIVRASNEPVAVIDLEAVVCTTPKSNPRKIPSTTGSSTPRGWLTKSSRHSSSGGSSPRTPISSRKPTAGRRSGHTSLKRKKLDNWFKDEDDPGEGPSTSVTRRRSAPSGGGGSAKRPSPRKKCFQERIIQRYNQILVSPTGFDSDFE